MRSAVVIGLVLLAGCSQAPSSRSESSPSATREEMSARAPAGVSVTAAPGVAFNYRYAFRMPNAKIAAVQEEHAQMCEKLGLDRCRITGMRYRLVDQDEVSAMLELKLDPAAARAFGKEGVAAVTRAEGMLIDSEISGTDAGAVIGDANKQTAQLQAELGRIEAQLRRAGLGDAERTELNQQIADLRERMRASAATRSDAQQSLATTPMVFDYSSGNLMPGFDGRSPLRSAIATASASFMTMVSFLVIAIGALLPWGVLAALVYWAFRAVRRRWPAAAPDQTGGE